MRATQAAFDIARPGATMVDLFHAMNAVVNPGSSESYAGRLGHGVGMQLTEWPSIIPDDHTPLAAGMVLTLEPGGIISGAKMMVHEENIVITENAPQFLSRFQPDKMRVI
jgi:Xaa-Pro aminopeptidase